MKNKRRISIKDISKDLGISITTISFIINNKAKGRITDEVIQKVENYIEEVGYRPNTSAQTLRTGRTKTIVFMAEDISDPFFSTVAKEMEEIAYASGYKMIYCSTENNKERTLELISLFQGRQVDAFIITPPENMEAELHQMINEKNEVVMLFDRHYMGSFDHNYVGLNNHQGASGAIKNLLEQGHKHIAYVGISSDFSCMAERREGYQEAVKNNQDEPLICMLPFDEVKSAEGKRIFSDFLKVNPQIDAILFATNGLAISGLKVLKQLGLRIPQEIAVITFDDRDLFELHSPSISVLCQPVRDLAQELIKGTLELLSSKKASKLPYQKILNGNLIVRESSLSRQNI